MTEKPLEDVWVTRDLPVLTEVTRRIDAGERPVSVETIAGATGLDPQLVELAGVALERRGFVEIWASDQSWCEQFNDIAGAAYLVTGLHPDGDDVLAQLVSVLEQAAERTSDDDERGRLRRAASAVGGLVGTVGANVLGAYLAAKLPQ